MRRVPTTKAEVDRSVVPWLERGLEPLRGWEKNVVTRDSSGPAPFSKVVSCTGRRRRSSRMVVVDTSVFLGNNQMKMYPRLSSIVRSPEVLSLWYLGRLFARRFPSYFCSAVSKRKIKRTRQCG